MEILLGAWFICKYISGHDGGVTETQNETHTTQLYGQHLLPYLCSYLLTALLFVRFLRI